MKNNKIQTQFINIQTHKPAKTVQFILIPFALPYSVHTVPIQLI